MKTILEQLQEAERMETPEQYKEICKQFIESKLPDKGFNKKDRLNIFNSEDRLNVKSVDSKPKKFKSNFEALKLIINEDFLCPYTGGIYHDLKNQCLVATDAHKMVVISQQVERDEIIHYKDLRLIDVRYPDWKSVIPDPSGLIVKVNIPVLLAKLRGVERANKFLNVGLTVNFTVGEQEWFFQVHVLLPVIELLAGFGAEWVNIELTQANRGVKIVYENITCLAMPQKGSDNGSVDISSLIIII